MHTFSDYISMMFGFDRGGICKKEGIAKPVTLAIGTIYTAIFTIALFFGDLAATQFINMESAIGMISTAITYTLGFSIIQRSREKRRSKFLIFLSLVLMSAQTALVFNMFPIHVTSILYYLATTLTLIFISGLSKAEKIINKSDEMF